LEAREFAAPISVAQAVGLLREAGPEARVLAGGTDLLAQMKSGRVAPRLVVDVKRIPELEELRLDAEGLTVGAAVCGMALREAPELRSLWPGLLEAAELIGSEQIQGRASLGGNLCNASPAADTVPALLAVRAQCIVASADGERRVPVAEFCTGPGETQLAAGELLVALFVPRPAPRSADAYLRLIPRSEMDIAVVGAAVQLTLSPEGRCSEARVALGAVAPTALLVPEAADALVGTALDEAALEAAASAARAAARPLDDMRGSVAYRTHVAGVLTKRAARIAAERAAAAGGAA